MLLDVNYDIITFFHGDRCYACTHALSRMQTNFRRKGNVVDYALRLLCAWYRVGIYGLFETYRLTHTHTPDLSTSPGPVSLHTRLGGRTHIDNKREEKSGIMFVIHKQRRKTTTAV